MERTVERTTTPAPLAPKNINKNQEIVLNVQRVEMTRAVKKEKNVVPKTRPAGQEQKEIPLKVNDIYAAIKNWLKASLKDMPKVACTARRTWKEYLKYILFLSGRGYFSLLISLLILLGVGNFLAYLRRIVTGDFELLRLSLELILLMQALIMITEDPDQVSIIISALILILKMENNFHVETDSITNKSVADAKESLRLLLEKFKKKKN